MLKFSRAPQFIIAVVAMIGILLLTAVDAQEKSKVEIVATLKGHSEPVYAVAFSQDGKNLVTGSWDNTLKLWDVASGKELRTFGGAGGHQKMVLSVAFSPDGQMIASGSVDNTLKVWDVPVSTPLKTFTGSDSLNAVALSLDGTKLAGAGKDGVIRIWTPADGKELFKMEGHTGAVTSLSFSPKGDVLASSGADGTVRYWNPADGKAIASVGAHTAPVNSVLMHPAQPQVFSAGDDGLIKFWQFPPIPFRTLPAHGGPVTSLILSADGNTVLTASADKTLRQSQFAGKEIRVLTGPQTNITSAGLGAIIAAGTADSKVYLWNGADGKPAGQFLAHGGAITSVNLNAAANQLMTTGGDGLVKFWAIPQVAQRSLPHPDTVLASALSADGKKLYTGGADKILRSWDLPKLAVERQFTGHTGPVSAVAISSNGQVLVSGGADATIRIWEQAKGTEVGSLGGHTGPITALAVNAAATQLFSASEDGSVKVWQLPLVAAKTIPHPDQISSIALSADGNKLITGGGDKVVRVWNLVTGAKEKDLPGPTLPVTAVAQNADGRLIAASSADKTVHVWTAADGKLLQKIAVAAAAQAVALNPDGKIVAAGLADNTIVLLDPVPPPAKDPKVKEKEKDKDKDKETKPLAGHTGPVTDLTFSPKGETLFSASADKSIRTWAIPGGAPGKIKLDHVGPVAAFALSKDGTKLAAVADKTVKVWNLADSKEIVSFATPADNKSVGFAPDGLRLVVGGTDKIARLYGLDGKLLEFFTGDGPVLASGFADAKRVVTAGADKLARVWSPSLVWQKFPTPAGDGKVSTSITQAILNAKGELLTGGADKMVRIYAADGKELKAFAAQEGPVVGLSLSTDGTRLATIGADKVAKVWNLTPGKEDTAKPLASFTLAVAPSSVALSPNGLRVAVGTTEKDTTLRIFDVALGKEVQIVPDHGGIVKTLAFLGDNRTLVSGSADKTARLSDINLLTAIDAHPGEIITAQYHTNGTQILTAGADKTVKVWDLAKNVVFKTFGPLADPIKTATFSRDSLQVGAAAGKVVKVWNLADAKEVQTLTHPVEVLSLSFNGDKTRIATGAADKLLRVWDIASGKEQQSFAQLEPVQAVQFHTANASILASAGKETRVETITFARSIAADGPVYALAPAVNNTQLFSAGDPGKGAATVKLWTIGTGLPEKIAFAAGKDKLRAVAVSKNGLLMATGGDDPIIRVYTTADAKEVGAIKTTGPVKALAFTPNNLALTGVMGDKSFSAWNVAFTAGQPMPAEFLQPIQTFAPADVLQDIVIGADNATIFTAGADKTVQQWKLASPTPTRNFAHPNLVDSVAFQPAGNLLASGCHDGKIRLYDLVKNVVAKEITAHATANANMIYAVAFSPDGKQIASGCYDGSMKLFDVATGNALREFKAYKVKDFEKGHQDPVYAVAFSPDGKFLASGSGGLERVIKIWNAADASLVRDLANPAIKTPPMQPVQSHPGWVYKLRFSKDGKLVSAGDAPQNKGYLAVWNPQDGKLLMSETFPLGTFFGLAVSPQSNLLALGAGPRGAPRPELNTAYLLKVPELGK